MSLEEFRDAASGGDSQIQNEKVKKYLEKEEKSTRKVRGFWHWLSAGIMAALVFIYFYSSGIAPISAQMHRGVYVLMTYTLIFLLYPAGSLWFRPILCLITGAGVSLAASVLLLFGSVDAMDARVVAVKELFADEGFGAALGGMGPLWTVAVAGVVLGLFLYALGLFWDRKFPNAPSPTDLILALASVGAVVYWITEFEALNYRMGA
ncbi:MAG: hypothetical protein IH608_05560, partial [Proteobacteria bacterium]|nr:hypothetical protein [Pseudomonadota bacterium]